MILPGMTPIAWVEGPCPRADEILRLDAARLDARASDRSERAARGEQRVVHHPSGRQHHRHRATVQIVEDREIGAPAGRDQAAVAQAENARGRDRRGAVGGERRRAEFYRRADEKIEMPLLGDVERIAVVGAEGDEGRIALGDDGAERMQVLAHRPFADQHLHALHQLLARFREVGHLVVGAHAGSQIAVEGQAAEQRAVSVDGARLKRRELGEAGRVAGEEARKIHEFGEAQHLRMIGERQKIADLEPRAGRLEVGRRHAARKLHAQVHRRRHRGVEEIAQARLPQHVGDLVRIADRRGHAMTQHAAVEFERRDQRAFDMEVRVDEAGRDDLSADVDLIARRCSRRASRRSGRRRWRRRWQQARR